HRYYEALRLPTAPHAALRFLRLALPRFPCLVSLPQGVTVPAGLGFGVPVTPDPAWSVETMGSLRFLGNPRVLMPCSLTPAGPTCQAIRHADAAPANLTTRAPTK